MNISFIDYNAINNLTEKTARALVAERAEWKRADDNARRSWYRVEWLESLCALISADNERFNNVLLRAYDIYESASNTERNARIKADETESALYNLESVRDLWQNIIMAE